ATATVGPGATGRDLVAALTPQHLAFPVGHCPSVALGGFLLSGGLGWNSRDWGVSCADVREIRVVTAAGRTVDCSEREHPDLFWAARGAGPGFCAAVTRFRLALHPHPASIMTTRYTFRIAETPVLTGWAEPVVRGLPPYVESSFVLTSWGPATEAAPAGPRITLSATAFAASAEQARQALAPLAEGPLVGLAVDEQPPVATTYAGLHEGAGSLWPPGHRYAADTLWSREGYRTQLSRIADTVAHAPSDRSLVLAPVKPVSEDPALLRNMAFAPLGASYLVAYAVWDDPDEDTAQGHWLQDTMAAADPDGDGLHYIAETDLEAGPARARRCYPPATWEHLQAVRERWDPEGRFHSYLAP
ncbi:FAD-binding oxidoreductase, partial [Streptomyces sp. NPDC056411]|uniref:FAD-binding oxidoreductase n=1 Tax=Streptomyces sp. NPDC056411 TaxID=3345813 RepID=UPI0035D84692